MTVAQTLILWSRMPVTLLRVSHAAWPHFSLLSPSSRSSCCPRHSPLGAADHFTAVSLAEVALCLAGWAGTTPHCRGSGVGGVLSPGVAVNTSALLARLESIGLLKVEVARVSRMQQDAARRGEGEAALQRTMDSAVSLGGSDEAAAAAIIADMGGTSDAEQATTAQRRAAAVESVLRRIAHQH